MRDPGNLDEAVGGVRDADAEFTRKLRESYPRAWFKITPAKARILRYLVDSGPTQLWPVAVLRAMPPLRRLKYVGYVEHLNRANPGLVVWHITPEGRAALDAADTTDPLSRSGRTQDPSPQSLKQEG